MSDQQTRLSSQNSILSRIKVRYVSPEDLGISSPDEPSEQFDDSERAEELREAAIEAAKEGVGVAVLTEDGYVYTGSPVDGNGWGVHALELAISKAVSDDDGGITSVAVYSDDGQSGLCGRCLQALTETRDSEVSVAVLSSDGVEGNFRLNDLAPWPSQV